jgi:alkanesulfonate monooxygenase SsuD/methylene tetrahydromethanopterin reductase-like flavin-dependent oxidoreductase (luciferase family)
VILDLAVPARGIAPADVLTLARSAERRGWRSVWLSEVLDVDAVAMASAILASTTRIEVGTAIVPVSTRSAAVLAMAASTLERLAPGRFRLGVGVSTPELLERAHDRPVRRPVAEVSGALTVLRAALRGAVVDHDADPRIQGLRVTAPAEPPPLLLAALGPAMTRVATSLADGLVLNLLPDAVAAERAAEGVREGGPGFRTSMLVRTVVDPTAEERAALRKEVASYLRVPVYAAALRRSGVELPDLDGELDGAARRLPDALLDSLTIQGSAATCRARIETLQRSGVGVLVVPAGGAAALDRTFAALSPRADDDPSERARP